MLPSLADVRYVGTQHFDTAIARSIVTALNTHTSGVVSADTVSAAYGTMVTKLKPFIALMHTEKNAADGNKPVLCPDAVAALTKYWVDEAWGHDLCSDPRTNAPLLWRVTAKDADYENRENILPAGQASLADGEFKEYRPSGSIPGTMRLFEGTNNWWVTDGGTHGGPQGTPAQTRRLNCRSAPWWVWPKATCTWLTWTIVPAGNGNGAAGAAVAKANHAVLPARTARESKFIDILRANWEEAAAGNQDELYASATLWSDAEFMLA